MLLSHLAHCVAPETRTPNAGSAKDRGEACAQGEPEPAGRATGSAEGAFRDHPEGDQCEPSINGGPEATSRKLGGGAGEAEASVSEGRARGITYG